MFLAVLLFICSALGGEGKKVRKTAKLEWGAAKAGLQVSLSFSGKVAVAGKFSCRVSMRNIGQAAVKLPAADASPEKELFGWLFVVQKTAGGKKAYYTEKIPLARGIKGFAAELTGKQTVRLNTDEVSHRLVHEYRRGLKVVGGYPAAKNDSKPLPHIPLKELREVLSPGRLAVRMMICLPGDSPILLRSNTVRLTVAPPDLKSLSPARRKAYVAKLMQKFDKSAWSGKTAHGQAVRLGQVIVPELIEAVFERSRPAHSRMWLATALAEIRDKRAAEALIKLLHDSLVAMRHVVAYHGPKQRNAKLDKAIVARTLELKESRMTALAVLGFLIARGEVNEQLLAVSLESPDPRVRSTAVSALSRHASVENIRKLVALLKDKNFRVRATAARALSAMNNHSRVVIDALIAALDTPDESVRFRVCDALVKLTKQPYQYKTDAPLKARRKTIQNWKTWWRKVKSK